MSEATIDVHDLRLSVELALDMLALQSTVVEAEVCASWCEQHLIPVHYDTERVTEGVLPARVTSVFGLGILLVIEDQHGRRIGFGSDEGNLSEEGITRAIEHAKANASADPYFQTLPGPLANRAALLSFADPEVVAIHPDDLRRLAFEALNGSLSTYKDAGYVTALQVKGAVRSRVEHLVVGNTHGVLAEETSTGLLATILCRLLQAQSQGMGSSMATHMADFAPYDAGATAAQQSLRMRGSQALAAGEYPVVFGPQAVANLLQDLLLPALSLDTVAAGVSPFARSLGQPVAAALLTVTDDGRRPGLLGSRGMTGEGLPTGVTTLLDQGQLSGFLADTYQANKLASQFGSMVPANGMRFATNGAHFGMRPGIFPTNVILSSPHATAPDALLSAFSDGLYVGDLWYTLPVGGLHTGNFTSTVTGSSFRIRHGKLAEPVRPESVRIQDNYLHILQRLTGLSNAPQATALATMRSLVLAPELGCSAARFIG
jgi:predicted Zn-dependent protease